MRGAHARSLEGARVPGVAILTTPTTGIWSTMASLNLVSVQDLVQQCVLDEKYLEKEVIVKHFYEISCYLSAWKLLAPKLNISQTDVKDIESDNPKAEMQRVSFLEKWKQNMSIKATYRELVDSLLSIKRVDDARGVCLVLKGRYDI